MCPIKLNHTQIDPQSGSALLLKSTLGLVEKKEGDFQIHGKKLNFGTSYIFFSIIRKSTLVSQLGCSSHIYMKLPSARLAIMTSSSIFSLNFGYRPLSLYKLESGKNDSPCIVSLITPKTFFKTSFPILKLFKALFDPAWFQLSFSKMFKNPALS